MQHSKADCAIEYSESLQCIEKKGREECEAVFELYKSCREKHNSPEARRRRRLAAREQHTAEANSQSTKETDKTSN